MMCIYIYTYIYICNKFKYKHYQHSSPTSLAPWPSTTCSPSVSSQQHQEVPSTSGVCPQQFSMLKMGVSPPWLAMLRWNQKMDSSSSRGINLSHSKSRKIQKNAKTSGISQVPNLEVLLHDLRQGISPQDANTACFWCRVIASFQMARENPKLAGWEWYFPTGLW